MPEWEKISARDDKQWLLNLDAFYISIYEPIISSKDWCFSCASLGIGGRIKATNMEDAKSEVLQLVKKRVSAISGAMRAFDPTFEWYKQP